LASEELYASLDELSVLGNRTPLDFALKVRAHPGHLKVTAASRMRDAVTTSVNYAGTISETTIFLRDEFAKAENLLNFEILLSNLKEQATGDQFRSESSYKVFKADPKDVLDFLAKYRRQPSNYRVDGELLGKYIRSRLNEPDLSRQELNEWHVLIASPAGASHRDSQLKFPDLSHISMVDRTANSHRGANSERFAFARLVTPEHELYDCKEGSSRYSEAMELTIRLWRQKISKSGEKESSLQVPQQPVPKAARLTRSKRVGLLMIYLIDPKSDDGEPRTSDKPYVGFAVSFPGSEKPGAVKWVLSPYSLSIDED